MGRYVLKGGGSYLTPSLDVPGNGLDSEWHIVYP